MFHLKSLWFYCLTQPQSVRLLISVMFICTDLSGKFIQLFKKFLCIRIVLCSEGRCWTRSCRGEPRAPWPPPRRRSWTLIQHTHRTVTHKHTLNTDTHKHTQLLRLVWRNQNKNLCYQILRTWQPDVSGSRDGAVGGVRNIQSELPVQTEVIRCSSSLFIFLQRFNLFFPLNKSFCVLLEQNPVFKMFVFIRSDGFSLDH